MNPITKGAIVKFINPKNKEEKGYYKVWSIRKDKVNLGVIFAKRHLYHKGVELKNLIECENEWYSAWQKTDSYQCM